jgi:hypothetical protein
MNRLPPRQISPASSNTPRRCSSGAGKPSSSPMPGTKPRAAGRSAPTSSTFVALGGEGKTSLVAKWAAELAHSWLAGLRRGLRVVLLQPGHARADHRFVRRVSGGSPHLLRRRGDGGQRARAFEKGRRLAQLVGERQALLILDGLEPLQYAPTSPTPGELKETVRESGVLKGWVSEDHWRWTNERIGTVHTVQGREAEAVILVLVRGALPRTSRRSWLGRRTAKSAERGCHSREGSHLRRWQPAALAGGRFVPRTRETPSLN